MAKVLATIDGVHGDGPLAAIPVTNKPGSGNLGVFRHYQNGKAVEIGYTTKGTQQELTLAHEIGHWLDHSGAPGLNVLATDTAGGVFDDVLKAAKKTKSFAALSAQCPTQKMRDYYLSHPEVFARAYSQFIAEESGDATMLQQVADVRADVLPDRHWETADFAPVRAELRKAFVKLGWMKEVKP